MLNGISDLMGAQTDRLRCEVFQNLILRPINTGTLRHAVATVLTVYGIETGSLLVISISSNAMKLQQCLPFTVLKRSRDRADIHNDVCVATVLTVYGIETNLTEICFFASSKLQQYLPFTVLETLELVQV